MALARQNSRSSVRLQEKNSKRKSNNSEQLDSMVMISANTSLSLNKSERSRDVVVNCSYDDQSDATRTNRDSTVACINTEKPYKLDRIKALEKKSVACARDTVTYEMKTGKNFVAEFSTSAFELFKNLLPENIDQLCDQSHVPLSYTTTLEKDRTGVVVTTVYHLTNRRSDGTVGRQTKCTAHVYHTQSRLLANGGRVDIFTDGIFMPLVEKIKEKHSDILIINRELKDVIERVTSKSSSCDNSPSTKATHKATLSRSYPRDPKNVDDPMFTCPICSYEANLDTIQCDTCQEWLHYNCANITQEDANNLPTSMPFNCSLCCDNVLYSNSQSLNSASNSKSSVSVVKQSSIATTYSSPAICQGQKVTPQDKGLASSDNVNQQECESNDHLNTRKGSQSIVNRCQMANNICVNVENSGLPISIKDKGRFPRLCTPPKEKDRLVNSPHPGYRNRPIAENSGRQSNPSSGTVCNSSPSQQQRKNFAKSVTSPISTPVSSTTNITANSITSEGQRKRPGVKGRPNDNLNSENLRLKTYITKLEQRLSDLERTKSLQEQLLRNQATPGNIGQTSSSGSNQSANISAHNHVHGLSFAHHSQTAHDNIGLTNNGCDLSTIHNRIDLLDGKLSLTLEYHKLLYNANVQNSLSSLNLQLSQCRLPQGSFYPPHMISPYQLHNYAYYPHAMYNPNIGIHPSYPQNMNHVVGVPLYGNISAPHRRVSQPRANTNHTRNQREMRSNSRFIRPDFTPVSTDTTIQHEQQTTHHVDMTQEQDIHRAPTASPDNCEQNCVENILDVSHVSHTESINLHSHTETLIETMQECSHHVSIDQNPTRKSQDGSPRSSTSQDQNHQVSTDHNDVHVLQDGNPKSSTSQDHFLYIPSLKTKPPDKVEKDLQRHW
ncbi:hypothetical protein FSP39_015364 [Pinctada imbricata]|uniref:PHD-type domain-containing protein n=1 Tax=Pinctada imbricata TaxID=66713 RepID=A0AA89BUA4_PINIB|nr:hypothetical protein FSP39_015364 [Pinctada imbricata]